MSIKKIIIRTVTWVGSSLATVAVLFIALNVMGGSTVSEAGSFLWRMIKNPTRIGAVAPTSSVAAQALIGHIPATGKPRHIIEAGAGTGSITQELVKVLQPGDVLDLVELDPELADILVQKFGSNPQINVINKSITDWRPAYKYDAMVMAIPFNALPYEITRAVWEHSKALMKPGAPVSYISYIGWHHVKKVFLNAQEKANYQANRDFMAQLRAQHQYGHKEVMANLPPADVFYLRMPSSAKAS